uniref:Tail collar fiber protein n=1 Tax=Podoviridae sp. ctsUe5 TaxID=2827750 RepID=A0A8S5S5L3_9CAUD|nr:MAG TPA: tail collar fiber protein [Podoviridae sp. ctsUe5]
MSEKDVVENVDSPGEIAIPIADNTTPGIASFDSNDFTVGTDGKVSSIVERGIPQYLGKITGTGTGTTDLNWEVDTNTVKQNKPIKLGEYIMLTKRFNQFVPGDIFRITNVQIEGSKYTVKTNNVRALSLASIVGPQGEQGSEGPQGVPYLAYTDSIESTVDPAPGSIMRLEDGHFNRTPIINAGEYQDVVTVDWYNTTTHRAFMVTGIIQGRDNSIVNNPWVAQITAATDITGAVGPQGKEGAGIADIVDIDYPHGEFTSVQYDTADGIKMQGIAKYLRNDGETYQIPTDIDIPLVAGAGISIDKKENEEKVEIKVEQSALEKIYGVDNVGAQDPSSLIRTDDAVGLGYTVGTSEITSDFDKCYPWSDIKEVTDSYGNIFVRIPKFYCKVTKNLNGKYKYQISGTKYEGFSTLFVDGKGNEIDYILIGKYEASGDSAKAYSKSGKPVLVNMTRAQFRTACKANGAGYQQYDFLIDAIIKQLWLVEMKTTNSQSVMMGYTVSNNHALQTGTTDIVSTPSGSPVRNTDGQHACKYRGIENPFGNVWAWCDGINFDTEKIYVCENPEYYADNKYDTPYTYMGDRLVAEGYLREVTPFAKNPLLGYATLLGADSKTFYSDYYYANNTGTELVSGSCWFFNEQAGLWFWYGGYTASDVAPYIGGRLCYKPISFTNGGIPVTPSGATVTATNGTFTSDEWATLQASDNNYILFNNEIYRLADKAHSGTTGIWSYTHTGWDGTDVMDKSINVTVATGAWTLVAGKEKVNISDNFVKVFTIPNGASSGTLTTDVKQKLCNPDGHNYYVYDDTSQMILKYSFNADDEIIQYQAVYLQTDKAYEITMQIFPSNGKWSRSQTVLNGGSSSGGKLYQHNYTITGTGDGNSVYCTTYKRTDTPMTISEVLSFFNSQTTVGRVVSIGVVKQYTSGGSGYFQNISGPDTYDVYFEGTDTEFDITASSNMTHNIIEL